MLEEGHCPECNNSHPAEECRRYRIVKVQFAPSLLLSQEEFYWSIHDTKEDVFCVGHNMEQCTGFCSVMRNMLENPHLFRWVKSENYLRVIEE